MAVTAHFGETIHYNAFTDVTSITNAVRADLEEKGFNITVGAYPYDFEDSIYVGETYTIAGVNLYKYDPEEQKIIIPTIEEVIRAAKAQDVVISSSDSFTYELMVAFKTTYINPSGSTPEINTGTVTFSAEFGS